MSVPYIALDQPISDFALLCRGCLAESGEMKNMSEWGLSEEFFRFTDIQIHTSNELSHLLCGNCEDALMKCKNFREQCRKSDEALKEAAKKKTTPTIETQTPDKEYEEIKENTVSIILFVDRLLMLITAPNMDAKVYLRCPHQCDYKCVKKKDLLLHLIKTHKNKKDFKIELQYYCSYELCTYHVNSGADKWFTERKFLNQHFFKVHKEKDLLCQCGMGFGKEVEYKRHLKTCNMIFACQICNVSYKSNERLLVHLLRKHPDVHKKYKDETKRKKRKIETVTESDNLSEYICGSPKRTSATQTLDPKDNIKNDVDIPSWMPKNYNDTTKTDEISTQTVFEDLLSLKSQTSEDESIFFSENVSLTDIQTQTFPLEFGLSRSNKETITSETQSPDLSIKETQTCYCLYESPKINYRLFDSVSSSPSSMNLTSTETQTSDVKTNLKSDVMLSFNSAETQTSFEESFNKNF